MSALTPLESKVRNHIYGHFVERGHPPTSDGTAQDLGIPSDEARGAFGTLHEKHAIVLRHGDRSRIRVAHPLSAYPTPFWVSTSKGKWWGNCAWDSLAIPAMLNVDATIETRSGADGGPVVLTVRNGKLTPSTGVCHIPLPARQWWDDVDYTCSNLLYFSSPDQVQPWLDRTGNQLGQVVPIETMWQLSKAWYGNRLQKDWEPRSVPAAEAILARFGLVGDFWRLHS